VRRILALILILSTALGVIYSVVVPPFEASDEKWHYPMVKYIADNWALPVQEPGVETPWRQEGSQPPLYYALAAAATFWIDTSDMETVRHLNPYVDAGATPDGNVNLVVHHPARELFPWRGTVLAVHIVRLLSVLMGTVAVYLTYLIVRQVLALGAAAIHAFTPMVVFISGSVNNDNLVVPLCSLALLMLLRMINPKPVLSKAEGSPTCPEQSRRACPEQSRRIPNPKSLTARYYPKSQIFDCSLFVIGVCFGPGGADQDHFAGADRADRIRRRGAGGAAPLVGRVFPGWSGHAAAIVAYRRMVVSA